MFIQKQYTIKIEKQKSFFYRMTLLATIFALLLMPSLFSAENQLENIRVGVLAKRGTETCLKKWTATAEYLSQQVSGYTFSIIPLNFNEVIGAVKNSEVEFILVNPGLYIALEYDFNIKRIATLVNCNLGTQFAGAIFTRADRDDINNVIDLKGKSFVTVDQNAFAGWQAARRELKHNGIDPYKNFNQISFAGTHDATVYAVRDGKADAGSIRSGILGKMANEGKISLDEFKVINIYRDANDKQYLHSTRHYPEWPFSKLNNISDQLARRVTIALFQMPNDAPAAKAASCLGWTIPENYKSVRECLKEIKVHPYEHYNEVTLRQAVRQHWITAVLVLGLGTIVLIFAIYASLSKSKIIKFTKELQHKESELGMNKDLLIRAQEMGKLGLWELDFKTNSIIWNHETYQIFEIEPGSKVDYNSFLDNIHPDDKKYVDQEWKDALKHKPYDVEHRIIINKKIKWVREKADFEFDKSGSPVRSIGLVQDITEEKQRREEQQKLEKLESIGMLAGGIAHDFNNILTSLFGNISVAKLKLEASHPAYKYLKTTEIALERATNLTNQLLTFAKGGAPIKTELQIAEIIQDLMAFDLSGSNVSFTIFSSKKLWSANVDKGQIQQVFSNLAINAIQAMPDGGELNIEIQNVKIIDLFTENLPQGKYIKITFQDEGTGMTEEIQNKIFDPYFSTKSTGSGLGLATAFSIIKKHKGSISVTSELQKGTTFTIYLPASATINKKNKKKNLKSATQVKVLEQKKVLIMDDDGIILELVAEILNTEGYSVKAVTNGKDAVLLYKKSFNHNDPFDIVILDLTIPGEMGGAETIKQILKINPSAKCIVSSGYANDTIMANYNEYGFKAIIQKPFTPQQIIEIINKTILT